MSNNRNLIPDGIYHVYNRGNNGIDIFHTDKDKYVFLNQIKEAQKIYGFTVYSYCLMTNHYHILIKDNGKSLSKIMELIQGNYVKYHNPEHSFKGHLFQGRFQDRMIEDANDFFTVVRYILRNPIVAGMTTDIYEYFWASSCMEHDKYNLIDFDYLCCIYNEFSNIPFSEYLASRYDDKHIAEFEVYRMCDKEAEIVYNKLLESMNIAQQITDLPKQIIDEIVCECIYRKMTKRQISLFSGITIYRVKQVDVPKFKYL